MNHTAIASLPSIAHAKLPAQYEAAKSALAQCERIDECRDWADKAAALASYAKQADDDTLEKHCIRIKARAIKRCGELLRAIKPSEGGRPKDIPTWECRCGHNNHKSDSECGNCHVSKRSGLKYSGSVPGYDSGNNSEGRPSGLSRQSAAASAGLSRDQAKQALRVANVPDEEFERDVESDDPPTVTALAERGKQRSPPKPITNLNGRSPADFRAATRFGAFMRPLHELVGNCDVAAVVRGLSARERRETRAEVGERRLAREGRADP